MENDPNKPIANQPEPVIPDIPYQTVPSITANSTNQPNNTTQPPDTPQADPVKRPSHFIVGALGLLIILAILLPDSYVAQFLAYPIIILGAVAGITFIVKSIKASKNSNLIVRPFIVLAGLGVGTVIFIVCLITGAIVGFSKDPNPQSCG